jgi:hypothetical protein
MAEKLITAIRTEEGDLKIDYQSLANKPQFDSNWKAANNLADATVVNNKIANAESKINKNTTDISKLAGDLDQLEATVGALGGDIGDLGNQGFITGSAVDSKLANYVKKTDQASKSSYGVVKVGTGLNVSNGVISVSVDSSGEDYVTEQELAQKQYLTASTLPIASKYAAGIVKIGDGLSISSGVLSMTSDSLPKANNYSSTYGVVLPSQTDFTCSNGYLQLEDIPLEKLSNVVVCSTTPSSPVSGKWYLVPWGGDG